MKVTSLISIIALSLTGAFGTAVAASAPPSVQSLTKDVAGIALGDSMEVAREKMKAANPNFQFLDIPTQSGQLYGVLAYEPDAPGTRRAKDAIMVIPSAAQKVASVSREVHLDQKDSFTREQFVKSLKDKYGPTPDQALEQFTAQWRYDVKGKLIDNYGKGCAGLLYGSDSHVAGQGDGVLRTNHQKVTSLPPDCLAAIVSNYKTDPLGIVTSYTVSMAHVKQFYDDVDAAENAQREAAEKQRADIESRAKAGSGPKL